MFGFAAVGAKSEQATVHSAPPPSSALFELNPTISFAAAIVKLLGPEFWQNLESPQKMKIEALAKKMLETFALQVRGSPLSCPVARCKWRPRVECQILGKTPQETGMSCVSVKRRKVCFLCVCDIFQFADLDVYCAVCVRLIYRPILGSEDKLLA